MTQQHTPILEPLKPGLYYLDTIECAKINAHDDLVAALKDAQKTVEKRFIECGRQGANAHTTNPLRTEWEHCRATLHEIEAALAKAEVKG